MKRTLLLCAIGLGLVVLGFAVDRARGKPASKPPRRLLILASESPPSVAAPNRSPQATLP